MVLGVSLVLGLEKPERRRLAFMYSLGPVVLAGPLPEIPLAGKGSSDGEVALQG